MSDRRLRVEFQRSGGVAGAILATSVDTGELPPSEAAELTELVDRVDLSALEGRSPEPGSGRPDRFQYDLTITVEDRRYRVSLGETDVPDELRPLLGRLLELARRR